MHVEILCKLWKSVRTWNSWSIGAAANGHCLKNLQTANFRFMIDTGFLSQDIFYAGEHLLDQRHFHLRKPHTLFQRSLRLIIMNCGFFTQNEIVSHLQSSPNSVVRFLKKFYDDTIFGSMLRLILNQRFKNKRRLESSSTSAKRKR